MFVYVLGYSECCKLLCDAINAVDGGIGHCLPICGDIGHSIGNFCPALCGKLFKNGTKTYTACTYACDTAYRLCSYEETGM